MKFWLIFFLTALNIIPRPTVSPPFVIPQTSPVGLFTKINQYRQQQHLPLFQADPSVCQKSSAHTLLVSISKYATTNLLLARLLEESTLQITLTDPHLTHLCITESNDLLSLTFTQFQTSPVYQPPLTPIKLIPKPTSPPTEFTEAQLWEALTIYRQAQGRSTLNRNDRYCDYARKRVQDHLSMMVSTKAAAYPNPDKYPLDAHRGFTQDAESGHAFDVTGATRLAENLAYYPNAQNATHIIEWGWDTSTEGHRETQLSNDWGQACISGQAGFYIAIFGN